MNNWLLIALYFLACFVASAAVVAVSLGVLIGRAIHAAISLGGGGNPPGVGAKLAPFGLLMPFVIFAAGTFLAQKPLRQTSLHEPARDAFSVAFALFPLAIYVATPFVLRGLQKLDEMISAPLLARAAEFERLLKSAPISVVIRRARFLGESGGGGILELTTEVKGVPAMLPYYELNIFDFEEEAVLYVDDHYADEDYEPSCKVINEGGRWEFRGYHRGRVLTTAPDTYTTRIRYLMKYGAALRRPSRIRFRLVVWKHEGKAYQNTCIFFYDWVTLPELTIEETP